MPFSISTLLCACILTSKIMGSFPNSSPFCSPFVAALFCDYFGVEKKTALYHKENRQYIYICQLLPTFYKEDSGKEKY